MPEGVLTTRASQLVHRVHDGPPGVQNGRLVATESVNALDDAVDVGQVEDPSRKGLRRVRNDADLRECGVGAVVSRVRAGFSFNPL